MAKTCNIDNVWIGDFLAIIIQVLFIFVFLTFFFFFYVIKVEKEEVNRQMNLTVDNIMGDIIHQLPELITKQTNFKKDDVILLINGILAIAEEKVSMESRKSVQDITNQNKLTRTKAFDYLKISSGFIVIISLTLFIIGFCIPFSSHLKDALIAVFFVGLTEFIFLTFIASKYISADPNAVRREIGKSVQDWIKKNYP